MTPKDILDGAIDPAIALLSTLGVSSDNRARVLMLAIAGQESAWSHRLQVGGPARSYWQFEEGGGVQGVLHHPASAPKIQLVCRHFDIQGDVPTVYEAMAWHDVLAASMARLLLFTDPAPLPNVGQVNEAWEYYRRNWRPGSPHPDAWPGRYETARELVQP